MHASGNSHCVACVSWRRGANLLTFMSYIMYINIFYRMSPTQYAACIDWSNSIPSKLDVRACVTRAYVWGGRGDERVQLIRAYSLASPEHLNDSLSLIQASLSLSLSLSFSLTHPPTLALNSFWSFPAFWITTHPYTIRTRLFLKSKILFFRKKIFFLLWSPLILVQLLQRDIVIAEYHYCSVQCLRLLFYFQQEAHGESRGGTILPISRTGI